MEKLKNFYNKYLSNLLVVNIVLAVGLNLLIEFLARKEFALLVDYVIGEFPVFIINTIIIFGTLSISIIFKRRIFVIVLVTMVWLAIGVTNGIILSERMTPFTVSDLQAIPEGLEMTIAYMAIGDIILYAGSLIVGIGLLIFLFLKLPKRKTVKNYRKLVAGVVLAGVFVGGSLAIGIKTETLDTFFPNLAYGYRDNGVPYSFLSTWLDQGVDKPEDYSEELISGIFTEEELNTTVHAEQTTKETGKLGPNIIFVQLESIIDPTAIEGIEFTKDPIPNYRQLQEENPSGLLTVPSMGAGTANTEFELLTGYSAKLFGPGEYAYKSIMADQVSESYAYDLKALGYGTHAIHNHRGVFYGRNEVYANLGFDTFTSLEYMIGVEKTEGNWAKDEILTENIFAALDSTEGKDYVFTVAVEGHGRYSETQIIENPEIEVITELDESLKWQYEHYVNLCYESDKFVGELIEEVSNYDEETVVVIYGDHLPAIESIDDSTLEGRNMYQTEYVVWSNYGIQDDFDGGDKVAYQLTAEVLDLIGIHEGVMTTFHQNYMGTEDYAENLLALQYDTLYGNMYIYNGRMPFTKTDLKMGVNDITVEEVVQIGDSYFIQGNNFNQYSKVNLDGEILDTFYISPTLLGLNEKVDPSEVVNMKVSQVESGNEILSTTE